MRFPSNWGTTGKGITYTATRLCTNTLEHDAFGKLLKQRNIVRLGPHAHIKQFLLCGTSSLDLAYNTLPN